MKTAHDVEHKHGCSICGGFVLCTKPNCMHDDLNRVIACSCLTKKQLKECEELAEVLYTRETNAEMEASSAITALVTEVRKQRTEIEKVRSKIEDDLRTELRLELQKALGLPTDILSSWSALIAVVQIRSLMHRIGPSEIRREVVRREAYTPCLCNGPWKDYSNPSNEVCGTCHGRKP